MVQLHQLPICRLNYLISYIYENMFYFFFSPDSTLICCGTSPVSTDPSSKSRLCFFETSSKIKAEGPVMQVSIHISVMNICKCLCLHIYVGVHIFINIYKKKFCLLISTHISRAFKYVFIHVS
jgi:hypothetical protein